MLSTCTVCTYVRTYVRTVRTYSTCFQYIRTSTSTHLCDHVTVRTTPDWWNAVVRLWKKDADLALRNRRNTWRLTAHVSREEDAQAALTYVEDLIDATREAQRRGGRRDMRSFAQDAHTPCVNCACVWSFSYADLIECQGEELSEELKKFQKRTKDGKFQRPPDVTLRTALEAQELSVAQWHGYRADLPSPPSRCDVFVDCRGFADLHRRDTHRGEYNFELCRTQLACARTRVLTVVLSTSTSTVLVLVLSTY